VTTANEQDFTFTDGEKKLLIERYVGHGYDPRDVHLLLWEGVEPRCAYDAFLSAYAGFVVEYMRLCGERAKGKPSADDAEGRRQQRDVRDIVFEMIRELADMDGGDDPLAKFHAMPKLVSAHDRLVRSTRDAEKHDLDVAGSIHNMMAASASRED